MPWYWIVLIISVIVGPFETLYAYNKAMERKRRRDALSRRRGASDRGDSSRTAERPRADPPLPAPRPARSGRTHPADPAAAAAR